MESRVMTIVWNDGKEPIITSANLPGEVTFHKNELSFIEEVHAFMEKKIKSLEEESQKWHDSHHRL